jgi:hypothetical protein
MVYLGMEGSIHPFPSLTQSAGTSFVAGALDVGRISGTVLKMPAWEVTELHRSTAAEIVTRQGALKECQRSLPIILGLMVMVWAFRLAVMSAVITPLGKWLLPTPTKPLVRKGRPTLSVEQQRTKTLHLFENSGWEMVFYLISASMGLYVYSQEEWTVWPSTQIWVQWPLQPMSTAFRGYYLLMLAFYIQALVSLIFIDKPRSDYMEYLLHHLVTIFLIGCSYYTRIHRYGLIILCLHDVGDVVLNAAKTFKYLGPAWDMTTNVLFVCFSMVFVGTRMVFLPITVIPSGYWELMQVEPSVPAFTAMNAALIVLQFLHVFWFVLLVKAIKRQIMDGTVHDDREDEVDVHKTE